MVLESLLNPFVVKKKPWEMFLVGVLYSFVSLFLAYISFPEHAGLLMVFFIVMSSIPLVYNAIKNEEQLDLEIHNEWILLREHAKLLLFLLHFFVGVVITLAVLYVLLPSSIVDSVFNVQIAAMNGVQNHVQGNITSFGLFSNIFFNNLKVLFFCLVFSFLFGVGAMFILTWNASVVAAAVGMLFKSRIAEIMSEVGAVNLFNYFSVGTFSFMRYMFHGIVEIAAYFIAGIAGSIISIAVIKHNLEESSVLYDALDMVLISLAVLFFAALVEVYVTPVFWGV